MISNLIMKLFSIIARDPRFYTDLGRFSLNRSESDQTVWWSVPTQLSRLWISDESFLTLHIRRLSTHVYQIVEQDVGIEIIWDLKARELLLFIQSND